MSTGLPITIKSARVKQSFISDYVLDIDIERNEPKVHKAEKPPNPTKYLGPEEASKKLEMRFCRRTSWMPPPPADTKHHPSSVNIELLKQIRMQSKCTVLKHFLQKRQFLRVYCFNVAEADLKRRSWAVEQDNAEIGKLDHGAWNGAELIVTIQGNWRQYGSRIRNYLRQLAVITPYAELSF
eukprot:gene19230-22990_t